MQALEYDKILAEMCCADCIILHGIDGLCAKIYKDELDHSTQERQVCMALLPPLLHVPSWNDAEV
jgi:hypothetical protein